ncbi:hypothetical protein RB195_007451 [Necator americanus]|uniref:Uncharacterized protein n=1 Tax=Necator americanus TaxID=51031 RepID=A0ABR1C021_NECAM
MHMRSTRSGQMEELLVPARPVRRPIGVKQWLASKECGTCSKLIRRGHGSKSSKENLLTFICQHAEGNGTYSRELKQRYKNSKRVQKHSHYFAKVLFRGDDVVQAVACFGHLGQTHHHFRFFLFFE